LGQWLISLGYPLSGDLSLDGYRSENWGFAQDAESAVAMWLGDDEHSSTMLSLDRSDIGVGIAFSQENDAYVVVVETALQTRSGKQQSEAYVILTGIPQTQAAYSDMSTQAAENGLLPQNMLPVALNTALADGNVYHDVKYGQTLWSIAITYGTTIKQIQQLNGLIDTTVQPG
jgi:LysM repeat protein